MFLGRIRGHVVATAKDPAIQGHQLRVVEPLKVRYEHEPAAANMAGETGQEGRFEVTGRAIVAMDTLGAGEGQLVLIVQGSSARMAEGCHQTPTDAVVIGIVDEAVVMGQQVE